MATATTGKAKAKAKGKTAATTADKPVTVQVTFRKHSVELNASKGGHFVVLSRRAYGKLAAMYRRNTPSLDPGLPALTALTAGAKEDDSDDSDDSVDGDDDPLISAGEEEGDGDGPEGEEVAAAAKVGRGREREEGGRGGARVESS